MSTFWHTLNPEYSGEAWLSLHDPKKKIRAADEREAVRRGRVSNRYIEEGNLPTVSVDAMIEYKDFEGFHEALDGCGKSIHIDYRRSRSGYVECDDSPDEMSREELREALLKLCTPALFDMFAECGKSWETLILVVKKDVAAGLGDENDSSI